MGFQKSEFSIIHTAAMFTYPVQPICTFSCTSVFFINIYYSQHNCITHFISLHILLILLYYLFPFSFPPIFIYIFSCVMFHCFYCLLFLFYFLFYYYYNCFFFLHFPLSGPVLTYISLLIIPCMIVYVTNNKEPMNP